MPNQSEVVVVTGASAGVGRATAVKFARSGASVALLARNEDGLKGAVEDVRKAGGKALSLEVDVADAAKVEEAASRVENAFGPIDIWVNCAMVTVFSPFHEMSAEEFRRVTEVTYLGAMHGTMAALKRMRERNRGTIVQVGSALSYRAIPLQSAYCGAKFGIRGFTDAVRVELMHEKSAVHITMVQLAAFNTPQFDVARHRLPNQPQPLPPIFQPEVAAKSIAWAACHRRRELWVGSSSFKTIVASQWMPGLMDRVMVKQAYDGQQDFSTSPPDPDREDNLFTTLSGDRGAHGRFDDRAKSYSWELRFAIHRRSLWSLFLLLLVCVVVVASLT